MATLPDSRSDVLNTSDEYQDITFGKESKRRKFHPFRAVRNIFRRRLRRVDSEEFQQSANKSRSTTELLDPKTDAKARFPTSVPYAVGLSVSHDSIFSPDPSTISLDLSQHCADFKSELMARIHARRSSEEDEDVGLPHSPCTSPTTAEVLSQNLKTKNTTKLTTTYSAGSLLSVASSENDEELFGNMNSSKSTVVDLDANHQSAPLSHSAAHHKISVRPKRTHGNPRRKPCPSNLPSTPEVCEMSFPEPTYEPIVEEKSVPLSISLSKTPEPRKISEPTPKKTPSDKKAKEDSKGVFSSMFKSRKGSDSDAPPDEPFFSRLFGSRRSNRKSKKSPHSEEFKGEHYRVLEPESPSFVSSNPKHNSYIYMGGDNRMISNILPPLSVPKPISLLDSKSPSSNGNMNISLFTKDAKITKVDESQNSMPRSQSYSSHRDLDYFASKESSKPFPQSTSFNLFPSSEQEKRGDNYGSQREDEARATYNERKLNQIERILDESVAASKELERNALHATDESQTVNCPLYFPIENTIECSADHDLPSLWSLESLSSLDDTGTKLKESREKLLEYLNPNKLQGLTKLDDSNQFASLQDHQKSLPIAKTSRSQSFKEYEKESPRKTKKQSTLPTILSKEDYDMLHFPEVSLESSCSQSFTVSGDSLIQESLPPTRTKPIVIETKGTTLPDKDTKNSTPTNNTPPSEKTFVPTKGVTSEKEVKIFALTKDPTLSEKDIKISAPNPAFIKKEPTKPAKVNTPSKYIFESESLASKETKLTPAVINNATNGDANREVKSIKKDDVAVSAAASSKIPNSNSMVLPKLVPDGDTDLPAVGKQRPNKLNLVDITKPLSSSSSLAETETPKDETTTKTSPMEPTPVSLVRRNKEMFRQLETKTFSSTSSGSSNNKRNSLPPKVSFEGLSGQSKATPQTTPCTTPSEQGQSELMSVFSKRSSKQKFEDQQNHNSQNNTETSKIVNNNKNINNNNNNNAATPNGNANHNVAQTVSGGNKDLPRKLSLKDAMLSSGTKELTNKESPSPPTLSKLPSFKVPTSPTKDSNKAASKIGEKMNKNDNQPVDNTQPKPPTLKSVLNKNALNSIKDANNLENLKEYVIPKSKDVIVESPSKKEIITDNGTKASKEALHCQRSRSLKCSSNINNEESQQAPTWLQLAHQRREERQTTERKVTGEPETLISTASLNKGSRSSKVLDMVNSYQKLQL